MFGGRVGVLEGRVGIFASRVGMLRVRRDVCGLFRGVYSQRRRLCETTTSVGASAGVLLAAESGLRIDAGGAAGGDPAREERRREEYERDRDEGRSVGRRHFEEQLLQEAGER